MSLTHPHYQEFSYAPLRLEDTPTGQPYWNYEPNQYLSTSKERPFDQELADALKLAFGNENPGDGTTSKFLESDSGYSQSAHSTQHPLDSYPVQDTFNHHYDGLSVPTASTSYAGSEEPFEGPTQCDLALGSLDSSNAPLSQEELSMFDDIVESDYSTSASDIAPAALLTTAPSSLLQASPLAANYASSSSRGDATSGGVDTSGGSLATEPPSLPQPTAPLSPPQTLPLIMNSALSSLTIITNTNRQVAVSTNTTSPGAYTITPTTIDSSLKRKASCHAMFHSFNEFVGTKEQLAEDRPSDHSEQPPLMKKPRATPKNARNQTSDTSTNKNKKGKRTGKKNVLGTDDGEPQSLFEQEKKAMLLLPWVFLNELSPPQDDTPPEWELIPQNPRRARCLVESCEQTGAPNDIKRHVLTHYPPTIICLSPGCKQAGSRIDGFKRHLFRGKGDCFYAHMAALRAGVPGYGPLTEEMKGHYFLEG